MFGNLINAIRTSNTGFQAIVQFGKVPAFMDGGRGSCEADGRDGGSVAVGVCDGVCLREGNTSAS